MFVVEFYEGFSSHQLNLENLTWLGEKVVKMLLSDVEIQIWDENLEKLLWSVLPLSHVKGLSLEMLVISGL